MGTSISYFCLGMALVSACALLFLWYRTLRRALDAQAKQMNENKEALALTLGEVGHARLMLQNVLDTVPVRVFWKDRKARYLGCNVSFAKDAGLDSPGRVMGVDDFAMAWAVNAEAYRADDFAVMESGKARLNYEESQMVGGVERTLRTSKIPLTDEAGEIIGVLGTYEDITELKRAELRLKHVNAILRSIRGVSNLIIQEKDLSVLIHQAAQILVRERGFIHAWIILCDEAGGITECAESSNRPWVQSFSEALREGKLPRCLEQSMQMGDLVVQQQGCGCETCVFEAGEVPHITLCRPLDCEGRQYGYIAAAADPVTFQDEEEKELFCEVCGDLAYALRGIELEQERSQAINELIVAKEIAESACSAKDEFLAMMSHEMRTPLNPIMGFANLMRAANPKEPEKTYLNTIVSAAKRQLGLIDNILNFTRLDKGTLEPRFSEFNLLEMCDCALRDIQSVAGALELRFENGTGDGGAVDPTLMVRGEYSMLMQLLDNLLNNACKYTQKGTVSLAVWQEDAGWVRFEVRDTGVGIARSLQHRLFDPFTQADSTYSREHEGIGMGLAICHKLIHVLSGEMGVESEVGKGSTFWFRVPLPAVIEQECAEHGEEGRLPRFEQPRHVLVVEDNANNRLFVERLIVAFGGTVRLACRGVEALDRCAEERFDVVLLDLAMPGMDGFEMYERLRAGLSVNQATPVIALSADMTDEAVTRCVAMGMAGHLSKPIRFHELFSALKEV